MILISIYYAPLHVALCRPQTMQTLVLPYLLAFFLWNNQNENEFDYESTNIHFRYDLRIQILWVFLNNLIFQLLNHFLFPSSMVVRLLNIYLFRSNSKILFLTSTFVGWLSGHFVWTQWVRWILIWLTQYSFFIANKLIRSNKYSLLNQYIKCTKYFVLDSVPFLPRIFHTLFIATLIFLLGRLPRNAWV